MADTRSELASVMNSCLYRTTLGVCMGLVYDQFAQELESLQRKYADRPRDENAPAARCSAISYQQRDPLRLQPE
jgi:hypothetical protein